ncbi:MAG: hypothetical protein K6G03_10730 [Lachnospiraceae bacterium]|nr:hypothetical protein [Lachnospiraceae bacterium]
MTTKEEMLNAISDLQKRIADMEIEDCNTDSEDLTLTQATADNCNDTVQSGSEMIQHIGDSISSTLANSEDPRLRELGLDMEQKFNEIKKNYRKNIYKDRKKLYELGAYESDKQFAEVIIEEHLEDLALADGFNLKDPSDAILPQKQAIRDEIASKSIERNMFDADVEMYGLMGSNAGSRFGLPGEIIGMGLGSVFGAIVGVADAIDIKMSL